MAEVGVHHSAPSGSGKFAICLNVAGPLTDFENSPSLDLKWLPLFISKDGLRFHFWPLELAIDVD